ncbi:hypothetical protein [Pseudomonas sp. GD03766]|uniref:hypothetical protein n=1 Tax=Pseudomonas sp. GD03766 TaxID=2975379 RepID=UPI002449CA74|nr:hypothetical protein [Pseudomonas sp. GD03766]MDH1692606.1 hypothetical protein [Pseudomonas sp. GD03766]
MNYLSLKFPIVSITMISAVFANSASAEGCEAFAKYGIYDSRKETTDIDKAASFRSWFCKSSFQTAGEANSAGADLGYGKLSLGYDESKENWSTFKSNYCSDKSYSEKYSEKTDLFVKSINTTASNNMLACFLRNGLHARVMPGAGDSVFYLQVRMNPSGLTNKAEVSNISVSGATCDGPIKTGYTITPAGAEQLCTRTGKQAVDIAITTTEYVTWDSPKGFKKIEDLPEPPKKKRIDIQAKDFTNGVNVATDQCVVGPGTLANASPCSPAKNSVEYKFQVKAPGEYNLAIKYAAATSRPVKITINGVIINANALSETTGGWLNSDMKWSDVAQVNLTEGTNIVRLEREDVFPHLHDLRFEPTGN